MTYAGLVGDFNPLHTNAHFARTGPYGQRVVHGLLSAAIATGLLNQLGFYDGTAEAFGRFRFRFVRPVYFGDTLSMHVTVCEKRDIPRSPSRGIVAFEGWVRNQDGKNVVIGWWEMVMKKRPRGSGE
jgi:acyl dehydratase